MSIVNAATAQTNSERARLRLMTLDPGHFHASLVQKFMYDDVDPRVHVYAPAGDDLDEHLTQIERFNTRSNLPTHWQETVYTAPDFLERMLAEKPGNVVVLAGNNTRKTDYILKSVQARLHVLADKPMAITPADFERLQQAFAVAASNHVLLYDIMTERYEITSMLQRELSRQSALFGELVKGSPEDPAIIQESVHHFSKTVAGAPLKRPAWFFDVRQEGEAIVDVAAHLVDLVQWEAFPEQALKPADVSLSSARRWATPITRAQFKQTTGAEDFPRYLRRDVSNDVLQVYANGEFSYRLRGVQARVTATWEFEAPPGADDTHYSVLRGTRARLVIRQGAAPGFKPVLYVENAGPAGEVAVEAALKTAIELLAPRYPGVGFRREGKAWCVTVPEIRCRARSAFCPGHRTFPALSARRAIAGMGSAEHDHQVRHDAEGLRVKPIRVRVQTTTTGFSSEPIPLISIRTVSCACSVNVSGGTMPVPVNRTAPCGKTWLRNK